MIDLAIVAKTVAAHRTTAEVATLLVSDRAARIAALIAATDIRVRFDGMRGAEATFAYLSSPDCTIRMAAETLHGWERLGRVARWYDVAKVKRAKLRRAIRLLETAAERMEAEYA